MNTISFDAEKAALVEAAVCCEFGNSISEIVSIKDTLVKKVVVFILSNQYGFGNRIIGHKYQMTYLYVPTVVLEITTLLKSDVSFNDKVTNVFKQIGYE
jgi:hypothetical protein